MPLGSLAQKTLRLRFKLQTRPTANPSSAEMLPHKAQTEDAALQAKFAPVAKTLADGETAILAELTAAQGSAQDVGGYFRPDANKAAQAMRPSATFNAALAAL